MSFIDINFPFNIGQNSHGGPEFSTQIASTKSGEEFRKQNLIYPKIQYKIASSNLSNQDLSDLIAFFYKTF